MKKKILIILITLLIGIGVVIVLLTQSKQFGKNTIEKYTFHVENRYTQGKYYIETEEELNYFYSLYTSEINIKKEELNSQTLFIEVESGKDNKERILTEVKINQNQIEFVIDRKDTPTNDKENNSTWFIIAYVPKSIAQNVDKKDYKKPSEVLFYTEEEIKDYNFQLDSDKKYEITTDEKYYTMQNDGGSHTNVYYQLDFEDAIVVKHEDTYHANLGGTETTDKKTIYTRFIPSTFAEELEKIIKEIITKEDINGEENYEPYVIKTENKEKEIYNAETIDTLKELLDELDELE